MLGFLCPRRNTRNTDGRNSTAPVKPPEMEEEEKEELVRKQPKDPIIEWQESPKRLENLEILLSK